jgi:hypothetical protein
MSVFMGNPLKKRGVKGVHPLGCLPLWGREGVTLQIADKWKRIKRKIGFQQSRFDVKITLSRNLTSNLRRVQKNFGTLLETSLGQNLFLQF